MPAVLEAEVKHFLSFCNSKPGCGGYMKYKTHPLGSFLVLSILKRRLVK